MARLRGRSRPGSPHAVGGACGPHSVHSVEETETTESAPEAHGKRPPAWAGHPLPAPPFPLRVQGFGARPPGDRTVRLWPAGEPSQGDVAFSCFRREGKGPFFTLFFFFCFCFASCCTLWKSIRSNLEHSPPHTLSFIYFSLFRTISPRILMDSVSKFSRFPGFQQIWSLHSEF